MFIGHFGVGFGAKKLAPEVSLGTLILAAQFVDLLFPLFVLLGLEALRVDPGNTRVVPIDFFRYPFTHSLATGVGWGLLLALGYFAVRRRARGALVVGLAVVSHWVLDWISHRPDMPLWPGGPRVGLGLWNSVAGTVIVEGAIFVLGVALYVRGTRARDRVGTWALWSLVGFLVVLYALNLMSPPPPNIDSFAWVGLAAWMFVPWGYWIDRHRTARAGVRSSHD
jgi:LexA-binding, inner membrane-associated putative hydrolase